MIHVAQGDKYLHDIWDLPTLKLKIEARKSNISLKQWITNISAKNSHQLVSILKSPKYGQILIFMEVY